jgi:Golgi apparatus protein 1
MQLSWTCEEQLFRQEVENADDIRLSSRLFKACMKDKKRFCADTPPGGCERNYLSGASRRHLNTSIRG